MELITLVLLSLSEISILGPSDANDIALKLDWVFLLLEDIGT